MDYQDRDGYSAGTTRAIATNGRNYAFGGYNGTVYLALLKLQPFN
jgi:hypothetical protein